MDPCVHVCSDRNVRVCEINAGRERKKKRISSTGLLFFRPYRRRPFRRYISFFIDRRGGNTGTVMPSTRVYRSDSNDIAFAVNRNYLPGRLTLRKITLAMSRNVYFRSKRSCERTSSSERYRLLRRVIQTF